MSVTTSPTDAGLAGSSGPEVPTVVSSWNEWDPLEEVVVGRADGACFDPAEPGYRPQIRGPRAPGETFPVGPKSAETIRRANEELDNLSALLADRGIVVRRPDVVNFDHPLRTPEFDVPTQYCSVCPRDVVITLGRQVLEATMSRRARYFEYLPYRRLIRDYWNRDPRMIWTAAPKPSMADDMYREEFWELTQEERFARMHEFEFCVGQEEPVFDAADMTRMGRDVFVQESMTTNRPGIAWLRRELEPRGLRVHPVHFPLDFFPSHIDCTFVPLRPGLVLTNPDRPIKDEDATFFTKNDWRFLDAPEASSTNDEMPKYCQSSRWLSMNVLSISPDTIICEDSEVGVHRLLRAEGFEVITVPFRNVYEFGGSLHCATWDVRRTGECADYFPHFGPG
ncbi:arginine deiminase family protein [Actinoplanes derwentensis]|uniref:Glycine amidinotransferase n=1 Tax=Actinoplanes derwentensis TaxID=113562 RepID=A0A1H2DDL8_9ACTN|nr:arginine deiminase family protein [Actinoplanes derwentensis]SDT80592.1 glycine amidinotransferase [Actinoplanes derwentensis]